MVLDLHSLVQNSVLFCMVINEMMSIVEAITTEQ